MIVPVVALASSLALVPTVGTAPGFASSSAAPTEVAPTTAPPAAPPPADLAPPTAPPPADLAPPPAAPPPAAPPTAAPPTETAAPPTAVAPPPSPAPPPSGAVPPGAAPPPGDPPPSDLAPGPEQAVPAEDSAIEIVAAEPEAVPAPSQPAEPPVAPPPPPSNGRGLLIAAAAVGTLGGIIRIGTSVQVARANALVRAGELEGDAPIAVAMQGAVFHAPLIATAIGLAAGGMARRGRFEAHDELFEGEEAARPRRKRVGWILFGSGVAVWTVTRLAGLLSCRDGVCASRVWEAGYYVSLAGTVPGAIMGGYATGFEGYQKRFGHVADVRLAPVASQQSWGMALSGRF
ncbi:hypothetical protein [Paraliomyxa miuraensis]|uniref:hypothetical protein n=1 Tax=Paraliomyxa miuraensis TaxID=376150 RepID=UPI002252FEA8|nr:hypothetical protein [Paraliomyxa miuraensis]MCX4241182.1 hypothetical protein [Paraliomyxa miuraensis]